MAQEPFDGPESNLEPILNPTDLVQEACNLPEVASPVKEEGALKKCDSGAITFPTKLVLKCTVSRKEDIAETPSSPSVSTIGELSAKKDEEGPNSPVEVISNRESVTSSTHLYEAAAAEVPQGIIDFVATNSATLTLPESIQPSEEAPITTTTATTTAPPFEERPQEQPVEQNLVDPVPAPASNLFEVDTSLKSNLILLHSQDAEDFSANATSNADTSNGTTGKGESVKSTTAPRRRGGPNIRRSGRGKYGGANSSRYNGNDGANQAAAPIVIPDPDEDDPDFPVEEHYILRVPGSLAAELRPLVSAREKMPHVQLEFTSELGGYFVVHGLGQPFRIVDLPCIIESQKTFDNKQFYKVGDVSQMFLVSDTEPVPREPPPPPSPLPQLQHDMLLHSHQMQILEQQQQPQYQSHHDPQTHSMHFSFQNQQQSSVENPQMQLQVQPEQAQPPFYSSATANGTNFLMPPFLSNSQPENLFSLENQVNSSALPQAQAFNSIENPPILYSNIGMYGNASIETQLNPVGDNIIFNQNTSHINQQMPQLYENNVSTGGSMYFNQAAVSTVAHSATNGSQAIEPAANTGGDEAIKQDFSNYDPDNDPNAVPDVLVSYVHNEPPRPMQWPDGITPPTRRIRTRRFRKRPVNNDAEMIEATVEALLRADLQAEETIVSVVDPRSGARWLHTIIETDRHQWLMKMQKEKELAKQKQQGLHQGLMDQGAQQAGKDQNGGQSVNNGNELNQDSQLRDEQFQSDSADKADEQNDSEVFGTVDVSWGFGDNDDEDEDDENEDDDNDGDNEDEGDDNTGAEYSFEGQSLKGRQKAEFSQNPEIPKRYGYSDDDDADGEYDDEYNSENEDAKSEDDTDDDEDDFRDTDDNQSSSDSNSDDNDDAGYKKVSKGTEKNKADGKSLRKQLSQKALRKLKSKEKTTQPDKSAKKNSWAKYKHCIQAQSNFITGSEDEVGSGVDCAEDNDDDDDVDDVDDDEEADDLQETDDADHYGPRGLKQYTPGPKRQSNRLSASPGKKESTLTSDMSQDEYASNASDGDLDSAEAEAEERDRRANGFRQELVGLHKRLEELLERQKATQNAALKLRYDEFLRQTRQEIEAKRRLLSECCASSEEEIEQDDHSDDQDVNNTAAENSDEGDVSTAQE